MSTPVRASDRDLSALAAIVSQDRHDLPDGAEGLPLSLMADLMDQIRCDEVSLEYFDSGQLETRFWSTFRQMPKALSKALPRPRTCSRCTGGTTGIACPAVIPTAPATCAGS